MFSESHTRKEIIDRRLKEAGWDGIRIDKIEAAQVLSHPAIADKEITALRVQAADLPAKSVTVMESRADLARCEADAFWQPLTADGLAFLRHVIQPLFRVVSQADFKAMRFEKDVLEAYRIQREQATLYQTAA